MKNQQENLYTPPQAALADTDAKPGSPVKAVLLGVMTDIGGTLAVSLVLGIVYGMKLAASGASQEEIGALSANPTLDSGFSIAASLLGCGFSVLGGYVCARIAKHSEYRLGAITGAIAAMIGMLLGASSYPLAADIGLAGLTFLSVMLGARLGYGKNRTLRTAHD